MKNKTRLLALLLVLLAPLAVPPAQALTPQEFERVRQLINKGNALMIRKQYQAAVSEYEQALQIDPTSAIAKLNIAETHNNWGIAFYSQHKFAEAIAHWKECLAINPKHLKAKHNIELGLRAAEQEGIDPMAEEVGAESGKKGLDPEDDPDRLAISGKDPKKKQTPGSKTSGANGDAALTGGVGAADAFATVETPDPQGAGAFSTSVTPPHQAHSPYSVPVTHTVSGKTQQPVEAPPSDTGVNGAVMIIRSDGDKPSEQPAAPSSATAPMQQTLPPAQAVSQPVYQQAPPQAVPAAAPTSAYQQPAGGMINFVSPTYSVLPRQFPNQPATPPAAIQTPAPASATSVIPGTAAAPPAEAPTGVSLNDQLGAIEIKFSGQQQPDLTVLQRLERLEQATFGKLQTGTILDRIQALRRSYGMQ